jgi:asparagine synthase (glutamine-hydrolysing)
LASKFVKVVLSGIGGDELFGGYPWRYYVGSGSRNFEQYVDHYYQYWHRMLSNEQLQRLFRPIWSEVADLNTRDVFRDVFSFHANDLKTPQDYVNHSLYFEAKTFMHGLFVVEDKLSMVNGLETRVPFMDNDLVDFAMRCPVNLKVQHFGRDMRIDENQQGNKKETYNQQTKHGKSILRKVMTGIIPQTITESTKRGFSSPDSSWFKGESIDFVRNRLLVNDSPIYEYLEKDVTQTLLSMHNEGIENKRLLIWSLLSFDSLLRVNK